MKTYQYTISQLIGLGMLIAFAFVGWCGACYLYGSIKGAQVQQEFLMKNGAYIVKGGTQ